MGRRNVAWTSSEVLSGSTSFSARSRFPPASRACAGPWRLAPHRSVRHGLVGSPTPAGRMERPRRRGSCTWGPFQLLPGSSSAPGATEEEQGLAALWAAPGSTKPLHREQWSPGPGEQLPEPLGCPRPCPRPRSPHGCGHLFGWIKPAAIFGACEVLWQGPRRWRQGGWH